MEKAKEIYMYALGAIIVLGIIALIALLIYVPMPTANKDVLLVAVGVFTAKFADVVSYFYGSSKSSGDKTKIMAENKK